MWLPETPVFRAVILVLWYGFKYLYRPNKIYIISIQKLEMLLYCIWSNIMYTRWTLIIALYMNFPCVILVWLRNIYVISKDHIYNDEYMVTIPYISQPPTKKNYDYDTNPINGDPHYTTLKWRINRQYSRLIILTQCHCQCSSLQCKISSSIKLHVSSAPKETGHIDIGIIGIE